MDISRVKLQKLYGQAKEDLVKNLDIPQTLSGNCTNISHMMLPYARELFGRDVRLVVGWFEMFGKKQFYFSDQELQQWMKGNNLKENNIVHCWLAKGNQVIDLTLATTIIENSLGKIPSTTTYIDNRKAKKLKIKYHEKISGDNVLHKLNFLK